MFFPQKTQQTPKFGIFQLQNVLVYLNQSKFHVRLDEIFGEKNGDCNVVIVAKFRFNEVNIHFNCLIEKKYASISFVHSSSRPFLKGDGTFEKLI